jgi:hypothetical protein
VARENDKVPLKAHGGHENQANGICEYIHCDDISHMWRCVNQEPLPLPNSRIWWVMSSVSNNRDRKRSWDSFREEEREQQARHFNICQTGTISLGLSAWAFDWELSWAVKYYTCQEPLHLPHPVTQSLACLLGYLSLTSLVWSAGQLWHARLLLISEPPFQGVMREFYGFGMDVSQFRVNCASS